MRGLTLRTGVVVLTLTLAPALAAGQAPAHAPASARERLPLEDYVASLSVTTPAGVLRRVTPPRLASARVSETPAAESRSARPATPASEPGIATPIRECAMPVAAPDTLKSRPMIVVGLPGSAPAGVLRGCENPLGPAPTRP